MRVFVAMVMVWFVMFSSAFAQGVNIAHQCSYAKMNTYTGAAKTTIASSDELKYDVRHVHMDIAVNNRSVSIEGNVTTTAEVIEGNFALYVCELNKLLKVDSVIVDGKKANFNRVNDIINVFMPVILQVGAVFKATVYYHGVPDAGSVFFFQSGMNNAPAVEWGSPVTYTLSEPYNSKDWWPCKQYLQDKIDSADIWITVPDSLKAGSNGLLQKITPMPGNRSRYEWKTTYPTAYYLLSIAVAAYREYSYTRTMPDGKDVLVQNYIYDRPGALDTFKTKIDTTGDMLYYFSELFGTYPFYKEKYGHCMAPVFGGMEHQTMTTLHHFNSPLVAHELAHQWFGDNVTCASWRDIWLNEGMASYAEYLFAEKFWDEQSAYNYMQKVHNVVLGDSLVDGSIYLQPGDTVSPYRIFDNRLSYLKASAVIHTLRFLIDDDIVFFRILKKYQQQFAGGNADTKDFKLLAEQVSGMDMDAFFNEWIYGEGYPVYDVKWNYVNGKLMLQVQQEGVVPQSVPYFSIPVEVKLFSAEGDTIIRLGSGMTQSIYINMLHKVDGIAFDPRNMILDKATVFRDYSLGLSHVRDEVFVYPNPASNGWTVVNIAGGSELVLTDLNGKVLVQKKVVDGNGMYIPAAQLARGIYLLQVKVNNYNTIFKKITKL